MNSKRHRIGIKLVGGVVVGKNLLKQLIKQSVQGPYSRLVKINQRLGYATINRSGVYRSVCYV